MYLMTEMEEGQNNGSENNVLDKIEGDDLSTTQRMKNRLIETLKKDINNPKDDQALDTLLVIFEKDENPDDGVFEGDHGNYTLSETGVGSDVFERGLKNDHPETIQAIVELAFVAKEHFGDKTAFASETQDAEQNQMMMYAAELVGLNVGNPIDHSTLSPEIKAQMDIAFQATDAELNPENQPEITATAEPLPGVPEGAGLEAILAR